MVDYRREPLAALAMGINVILKRSEDLRITAAQMLKEAKRRIDAGEEPEYTDFWAWCRENIERSDRDIRRLLGIAEAPDPEEAMRQHRARNAEDNRQSRARARSARTSAAPDLRESGDADADVDADADAEAEHGFADAEPEAEEEVEIEIRPEYDDPIVERFLLHCQLTRHRLPMGVRIINVTRVAEAYGVPYAFDPDAPHTESVFEVDLPPDS